MHDRRMIHSAFHSHVTWRFAAKSSTSSRIPCEAGMADPVGPGLSFLWMALSHSPSAREDSPWDPHWTPDAGMHVETIIMAFAINCCWMLLICGLGMIRVLRGSFGQEYPQQSPWWWHLCSLQRHQGAVLQPCWALLPCHIASGYD